MESVKKSGVGDQRRLKMSAPATVRRPRNSRRSTPDLLTLSHLSENGEKRC